jgi:hypothetical protein
VDALLNAENRSVFKRDDPKAPELKTPKTSASLSVQAIYGAESNIKVDLNYGDEKYVGQSIGERIGPYEIRSVLGRCVDLYFVKPVKQGSYVSQAQLPSTIGEHVGKTDRKDKAIQVCWSAPPAMPLQAFSAMSSGPPVAGLGYKSTFPLPPSKTWATSPVPR